VGNAQNVTLKQATAAYEKEERAYLASLSANKANPSVPISYPGDVFTNGQCISINSATHVTIENNLIHDCSASGIDVESSDYTTIENNIVFNTSWWTAYGTSGINLHLSLNSDGNTGYRNLIINNISHDNGNTQPFFAHGIGGKPTDGNGIIVDTNQATSNGQPYIGRTLIMGNIVYNNGGSGIHAYLSAHVDIYNNSASLNNTCPVTGSTCGDIDEGQIFGNQSNDINIYNNIMYGPKNKLTYSDWANTALTEGHNIMISEGGQVILDSWTSLDVSDIVVGPQWVDAALVANSSFSPAADRANVESPAISQKALVPSRTSPARNAGTTVLDNGAAMTIPPESLNGNLDRRIDIGALSVPSTE